MNFDAVTARLRRIGRSLPSWFPPVETGLLLLMGLLALSGGR